MLYDISTLTITLADWQGAAKVAFIDSKNKELPELIRWSDGTLQAADALKNYYFKLEEAKQKVDAIRGQADDLWDDFQPLSFLNNKALWEEYKKKLAELGILSWSDLMSRDRLRISFWHAQIDPRSPGS